MAYLTKTEARTAADMADIRDDTSTEYEVRRTARAPSQDFEIFLSHSYEDRHVIRGVKELIEAQGPAVYVDWLTDTEYSREHVTADTADNLRQRMRRCSRMIFVTSTHSPQSKWMPWELGFFDGHRPGNIKVLPVLDHPDQLFTGQEYVGLYPLVTITRIPGRSPRLAL